MKILDKYVLKECATYFTLSLITFITLFAVIDGVSNIDLFIKFGVKVGGSYILGRIPLYTVRVIPIATLISTMATLSKFSSTSELIVVKALGISLYRFSIPIMAFSLLTSLLSLSVENELVPLGIKKVKEVQKLTGKNEEKEPFVGIWIKRGKGKFIHFTVYKPKEKIGEKVSLFVVKDFQPIERIDALKAKYLKGTLWEFKGAFVRKLNEGKSRNVKELTVNLGISPKEILLSRKPPQEKSLIELYLDIKKLEKVGYESNQLKLELFSRLALALMPFIATLIGIPLGVYNPRNKKGYTVIVAALTIVVMWITVSFFLSLGKGEVLPPFYASFAPLFIFSSVGLILLGRLDT